MSGMAPTTPGVTVVKHSAGYHLFLWTAFPLVGALAGWLLSELPGWVDGKPVPFGFVFRTLDDLSGPVLTIALIALGAVGGAVLSLSAYDEVVRLDISDSTIEVKVTDTAKSYRRDQIDAVFVEGKTMVMQARDTSELVRQKTEHSSDRLKAAFESHGYPWREGDPHEAELARWVDGVPGLSEHANAILRARQVAIDADKKSDITELHAEAARLGVVVRDVKKRQYWRSVND